MPDLHLRVVGAGVTREVVVAVEPTHTVGELATALACHLGVGGMPALLRSGRRLDPGAPAGRSGLVCGDVLTLDGATHGPEPTSPGVGDDRVVTVDVVAGPESGRACVVGVPGRCSIGRGDDVTIRLADPTVSRRHAVVEVDRTGRVTVEPCGRPANGVLVDALEIAGATPVGPTDVVSLGATRLSIRPLPTDRSPAADHFARIDVHRTPYRPPIVRERATDPIGPIPEHPEPRRLQLIGVLAPVAAGVVMWAFTRQVQFLALTLVSPVVLLGSTVEDRRSGRRAARARVAAFRADLVARRRRFEQLRDDERVERLRASPDLADLIRRAELRTTDLWARGRDAPDFLSVRLGLGPDTVRFPIELERGGADDLRAEALAAVAGLDRLDDVPVTVDLVEDRVFALHGPAEIVDGVAASLLVQAAVLHSPEDLVVAGAIAADRPFDWLRWLPHARSVTSPLAGDHLVRTPDATGALVDRLIDVATHRRAGGAPAWPRLLVLVDARSVPDAARMSQLLDLLPGAGISILWSAPTPVDVPRQAGRTLAVQWSATGAMRGRSWSTDPEIPDRQVELDHLRPGLADRAARALAPLRDASTASLATTIPRLAPLLDVLGVGRPTTAWVLDRWEHRPAGGLRFPIGIGADGPLELDLVEDGPHTLIGGTSGSGKSELLQSMVASLAAHHPPTRLNFLFVDYKGGAFAQAFDRLPHAVGSVTDLSPELASRALVSLRAEVHRRMALLEGRAKDLDELLAIAPDAAPASLVIVVDEFATLVREIPEFVAGIVDVAQRGRSLGIHLVLATQRPTGSVNDNILANTNLRLSLRLLDRAESSAVLGASDAAEIPVPLRGRGFVRLGPRRLVELQTAFGGAPLVAAAERPPVLVVPFVATDDSPRAAAPEVAAGPTQLDAVVDAVVAADRRLGLPPPHRPWQPVLPDLVLLDDVLDAEGLDDVRAVPGRFVAFGLLDAPERQEQRPAVVDLEDGGGLLVFGSGGAGATTLLRTIAASVGHGFGSQVGDGAVDDVVVVAFDVAGRGLAGLRALPHVTAVVTGDDPEALTRQLLLLDAEVARRRRRCAAAGAEHAAESAREHPDTPPRVVVLIDGFGSLAGTLFDAPGAVGGDDWSERIVRLVVDGRQVGIHVVITADRRAAVPARIHAAVANRLILRHADDASALDHGVPADLVRRLRPGRGLLHGSAFVQIASVSSDPSARSQHEALADRARRASSAGRPRGPLFRSAPLPERVEPATVAPITDGGIVLGLADVTGEPVTVDRSGSLTVCGPPRSGRSTALAAVLAGLVDGTTAGTPVDVLVVGPPTSPLRRTGHVGVRTAFGGDVVPALQRFVDEVANGGPDLRRVLVVDDADALDGPGHLDVLEHLVRLPDLALVVSMESRSMTGFTVSPLVGPARRARRLLVLQPDDPAELLQATGVRIRLRPGLTMPPGRGVLLAERVPTVVQVVDALGARPSAGREHCWSRSVTPHRYSRVDVP